MTQLLALALAGCSPGPIAAPDGYELAVPEDQTFGMDAGYVTPDDGIGFLFLATLKVTDENDYSANGILVEVLTNWTGAYIVPAQAVNYVSSYEDACVENPTETCAAYFDPENGYYFEFSGNYDGADDFHPTYFAGATDQNGNMRLYILVDSVPIDADGNPVSVRVYAEIATESQSWSLSPIGAEASE